jgi:tetratricopeptide (TPR) repeat protein/SAM-dependent methyltransferase
VTIEQALQQGITEHKEGNFQEAEAHYNSGTMLQELGRLEAAGASLKQAIALKPDLFEAHYNLGNALKDLGRLNEAEVSYNQAIALKPDYAAAHSNLGKTLKELGRLDEAEASYKQAVAFKPCYTEAHYNLGITLHELGKFGEAISAYFQAITLKPDFTEATNNFGITIQNVRFTSSYRKLYPILINLLTVGNVIRPTDVAWSILSLLKHDPLIKDLLNEKNVIRDQKEVTSAIETLDKIPLLHQLMRICPLPDLQLEGLFIVMRKLLLSHLHEMEASPELIYFLSTLSLQCFTNEYIYFESDEEIKLIDDLEIKIVQAIAQTEQPNLIEVLCLSSYRPLHNYNWCEKLVVIDQLTEVKARLIEQPIVERAIAKDILVLGEISNKVSLKVRQQYEENPYPRWVKLAIPKKTKSVAKFFDDISLELHSENIKDVVAPLILIAGCGTGQQSIETASRFSDGQALAVDLSLTSLAYAKRKTDELGVNNLEYFQADILNLSQLDREFDIIESSGVLHHMDEPMAGWKVLTDLLKPGGLMRIGLYSELARGYIAMAREEIAFQGVGTSQNEMRNFRWSLIESNNKDILRLATSPNFYSLSNLRDLIFHVQEHRFTLPEISECLDELGLKFCGFESKPIISRFREFHENGSDIYDLALWHQFEESYPDIFAGMYQFWCQKL